MRKKILFVEDDSNLGYILSEYLLMHHFEVSWAKDGQQALEMLSAQLFDLCLLDIMLPELDGFAVADRVRADHPDVPFIFLTARNLKIDKLKGFRLGADDFITKPVDEEEMMARIHAVLRRTTRMTESTGDLKFGNTVFDSLTHKITSNGHASHLTAKEAEVLKLLVFNKNRITHRDLVLKKVWGSNDFFNRRSMDVIISRLRNHLQKDGSLIIRNIHGKGFVLEEL